jgi:hypothetical protein
MTAPAPKTPAGRPDLSGIWQPDWQTNTGGSSNLNLAADLKLDEIQPWAEALYRQLSQNFIKDHPFFHCLPGIGPATTLGMLGSYKILQTPGVKDQKRFRNNIQLSLEVLAKYVGVYQTMRPGGDPSAFSVTLDGDQLQISGIGPGRFPLTAQSETSFSLFSAYAADVEVDFEKDSQGLVTQLLIKGEIGGPQKATRKGSTP